jgi:hypothetical protein
VRDFVRRGDGNDGRGERAYGSNPVCRVAGRQCLDGDGTVEVVAATTRNATIAYSAADGSEEFRVPLSTYGYAKPTIDKVTAAPGPEIVTSDIDSHVVVAGGNGEVYWTRSLNATVWAAPAVGDVDADGRQEVVVGTNEFTIALNADGSLAWKADTAGEDLDTAQVDEDDATEVFVASGMGFTALDGSSSVTARSPHSDVARWGRVRATTPCLRHRVAR